MQTQTECVPDIPAMTYYLGQSTKLGETKFQIWVVFFLNTTNNSWRLHRPLLFVNTSLCSYIILFSRKLSAVFIILIESMNKINCFLGHCFTFFPGRQVFPYENYCKCYKKLTSRLWPMLFTLTYLFLIHTHSCSAAK